MIGENVRTILGQPYGCEKEENYHSVVERANDGIVIIQDEKVQYVNPAIGAMLGYDCDALIGTCFLDVIHPAQRDILRSHYHQRLAGEDVPAIYESVLVDRTRQNRFAMPGMRNAG